MKTNNFTNDYKGKYLADYDHDFYNWSIANLPSAKNFYVQDIDALIRSRSGGLQLLEIKRNGFTPKPYQKRNMLLIDAILKHFFETTDGVVTIEINGKIENHSLSYSGYNLLQLTSTSFTNSNFVWNGEHITTNELIENLNFTNSVPNYVTDC